MANRYWVGGSGNWSDTAHWSDVVSGTGGASVPTVGDTANIFYVDASTTINQDVDITGLAYFYFGSFSGTFNTNSHSISVTDMFEVPTGTVNFGSSVLSARRVSLHSALGDCSGLTVNLGTDADTTAITCVLSLAGAGQTLSTLNLRGSGNVQFRGLRTTYTINSFNILGTNKIVELVMGSTTCSVGTFSATGTAGNPITITSDAYVLTFSKPSGTVNCNYLNLKNSHAIGGATWNAGANSIDNGGNTGWIFGAAGPCSYTAAQAVPSHPSAAGTYVAAVVSANSATCTGGSWTASLPGGSPAWISNITPTSGSGPATTYVSVTLQENTSTSNSRSATIVVNGTNITVVQRAAPLPTCAFSVTGPVDMAYTSGDVVLVPIQKTPLGCTGGAWSTLHTPVDWLSFSPTNGDGTTTDLTFTTLTTNYDVTTRSTTVRFIDSSGDFYDLVVTQASAYVHCDGYTTNDVGPYHFSTAAATSSVTLTGSPSGCNQGLYDVESDSAWLTVVSFMPDPPGDYIIIPGVGPFSFQTGTFTVALEENTGASAREGHITITSETAEVLYIITYIQAGTDTPVTCTSFSTLQAGPFSLPWEGSVYATEIPIPVVGSPVGCVDGTWSVVSNDAWLSVSTPVAGAFRVAWLTNPAMVARTGTVTINGNPDQVITFNQEPAAVLPEYCSSLTCPQAGTYSVSHPPSSLNFTLVGNTSTCEFQNLSVAVSDGSWLTLESSSSKDYSVSWSQNTTDSVRTGTVTVSYTPFGGSFATGTILTITQYPLITALYPPFPPFDVVAVLNPDHTATVTWNNGGQLGLTGVQFQMVINGAIGTAESLPVVSRYVTGVLSPNTAYNFRVALVNDAGVSPVVTSNNVFFTAAVPPEAIKPPRNVTAFFDDPSQSIILEWDLNGQTDIDGYAIIGVNPTTSAIVYNPVLATRLVITDLSLFTSGVSYTFKVALTRSSGATRLTSPFTTSNAVTVVKPTNPRTIYSVKFFYSSN